MFSLFAIELERLEPLAAVVPYAMDTSRWFTVLEIHGAYVWTLCSREIVRSCEGVVFQPLEWPGSQSIRRCDRFVRIAGSRNRALCERKFITATKIGPSRDIAVMA